MSEKQIEGQAEQKESGYHGSEAAPVARPDVQIPQAIVDRYDANQKETHRQATLSGFFQGMTLVIVAAYTALTYWQWQAMLQQNRNSQHALEVTERAWVNVKPEFSSDTSPTVTGTLEITNSGKTPALHIEVNALIEVVPNGQEPHFGGEAGVLQHLKVTTGALSPNSPADSPADLPITRRKDGQEYPLTDAEITDLKEGRTWIAIHGRTTYKDVFKVPHWTQFCVWHGYATDPNAKLSAFSCTEYNSVDEQ